MLDWILCSRLVTERHIMAPFRKSHLACALLIIKLGTYKWPDTDPLRSGYINADKANPALKQTLKEGMHCKTWSHEDVYADLENYKLLMASDNWEADEQMGDDELSLLLTGFASVLLPQLQEGASPNSRL